MYFFAYILHPSTAPLSSPYENKTIFRVYDIMYFYKTKQVYYDFVKLYTDSYQKNYDTLYIDMKTKSIK